ncbi:AcrR family transcriptional regulator [Roseovarius sp. MBR-78]|uniref:TetR/AcrR family transcriptional regulator n=1 Tax=Roseovarius sp. MBR-78 TaxID=3156460 RepID=UPI003393DDA9
MTAARRPRLSRDDWLAAGLAALAECGPGALGAEQLARRIGTTKGSFYWHFTDVPAYCATLLARWQEAESPETDPDTPAATRLRGTAQAIATPHPAEPAIRAWAATDTLAAQAVASTDASRLARLAALLGDCGIANPDMARILLGAAIGMQALPDPDGNPDAIGSLVDLILALR